MKDRIFIDTNIFVYASLEDMLNIDKRDKAIKLIQDIDKKIVINTQVINEFYTILIKNKISDTDIQKKVDQIIENTELKIITLKTIKYGWKVREKLKYSYWDSLIIASALENDCFYLYTEDMHNEQIVEGKLKIVNPFKM